MRRTVRIKLFLIRKCKAIFIRYKLHILVEPFTGFMFTLIHLSKLSKWASAHRKKILYNDFYTYRWHYDKRLELYTHLFKTEHLHKPITYIELGVCGGHSIRWWVAQNVDPKTKFYGFDTFEGLPEDFGMFKAGSMSVSKVPDIPDSRVQLIKGLFQDTLPAFLNTFSTPYKLVIHMDADLYSSTLFALSRLYAFLKKEDIIIFDEFSVPKHEFLAFKNFTESHYVNLQPIAAVNNYYCTAFKVM